MAKFKETLGCGCVVAIDYNNMVKVVYCPKHKAAPDMYEALKLYQQHQKGTRGHYCSECHEAISKALAKAEGK